MNKQSLQVAIPGVETDGTDDRIVAVMNRLLREQTSTTAIHNIENILRARRAIIIAEDKLAQVLNEFGSMEYETRPIMKVRD